MAKNRSDITTVRLACAEPWKSSAALRKEFGGSFDAYVSYIAATVDGLARVIGGRRDPLTAAETEGISPALPLEKRARAAWNRSADLRAEFRKNLPCYLSYRRGVESGQVHP